MVIVEVVVVITNSWMTATQKRRLISNTNHITQEYWSTFLCKGSLRDCKTYHNEKYYDHNIMWRGGFLGVSENPFRKGKQIN